MVKYAISIGTWGIYSGKYIVSKYIDGYREEYLDSFGNWVSGDLYENFKITFNSRREAIGALKKKEGKKVKFTDM